ncbi:hypothetical protein F4803DRAFT_505210 [Xylaria telfairii]|nr:hypothetical protein F4803DRAFT_505210 [Xylaria telfairii]
MFCERRQPIYHRDKGWRPPYDLVIPPTYPAQYIFPPPSYNPTPGGQVLSTYQYGYHSTSNDQLRPGYSAVQNYPLFLNRYQPVTAPPNTAPMLPVCPTTMPYPTVQVTAYPAAYPMGYPMVNPMVHPTAYPTAHQMVHPMVHPMVHQLPGHCGPPLPYNAFPPRRLVADGQTLRMLHSFPHERRMQGTMGLGFGKEWWMTCG